MELGSYACSVKGRMNVNHER